MLSSPVIETAIGLIILFYALALFCCGAVELVATWMRKRSKYLIRGMRDLLEGTSDPGARVGPVAEASLERSEYRNALNAGPTATTTASTEVIAPNLTVAKVMAHGLVTPYKQTTPSGRVTRNPSYLPSTVFSRVVVDLLVQNGSASAATIEDLQQAIGRLPTGSQIKEALTGLVRSARSDMDTFLTSTEKWFDAQMDRVTGSYKRWAKRWVIAVSVVVVLAGGIDSIAIARALYADDTVRATVTAGSAQALCPPGASAEQCATNAKTFVDSAGLPIGPGNLIPAGGAAVWVSKIIGLLISIGAASMGAPFWYKLLDRIGTIRNAGSRPPTTTPSS